MKTVLIGIARMGSTRLPGKVMKVLGPLHVLEWVVSAGRKTIGVDETWIATSTLEQDNVIAEWCDLYCVPCFRGSETDVLSRFAGAARAAEADVVVRVTCDCPFLDPDVIGQVVRLRKTMEVDYASNIDPPVWPDGLDCEAFTTKALFEAEAEATRASDRDTVTQFILRNRHRYKAASLAAPLPGLHKERWVLDTENDYKFCQEIAKRLGLRIPASYLDILDILDREPELREINKDHPRNERFFEALASEPIVPRSYSKSVELQKKAEKYIPLGAQTFSKSKVQFPPETPRFLTHGQGGLVYDVDGNDFVDCVGGLLPVILGYRDPDVDEAIKRQLDNGISFSLATELEYELAARLSQHIPCAEKARFGKTGTDVTTAAVRLARAYTGRDLIYKARYGYHGWNDWSVARDTVRNRGTSDVAAKSTFMFNHGDRDAISIFLREGKVAAVIIEPETDPAFLKDLRYLCSTTGTLLIFDEIITGFRWDMGGAQSKFGVMPDLACFGKAMGNGMPISAVVGRADIMQLMEPPNNIFYSGTFFGETLSLAAAIATIDKLDALDVTKSLHKKLAMLLRRVQRHELSDIVSFDPTPLGRISFRPHEKATSEQMAAFFRQSMAQAGVLIINSHNLCHAHTANDLTRIVRAYDFTFERLEMALEQGNIADFVGTGVYQTNVRGPT